MDIKGVGQMMPHKDHKAPESLIFHEDSQDLQSSGSTCFQECMTPSPDWVFEVSELWQHLPHECARKLTNESFKKFRGLSFKSLVQSASGEQTPSTGAFLQQYKSLNARIYHYWSANGQQHTDLAEVLEVRIVQFPFSFMSDR